MNKGSCLCGAVKFEVSGELGSGEMCHCSMCRKWTGHILATTAPLLESVNIDGKENIKWFKSSEKANRGFCSTCGSPLFFDPIDKIKHQWIGISLGAFDTPTNIKIEQHIFVAEKGDYYEILDGAPQNEY